MAPLTLTLRYARTTDSLLPQWAADASGRYWRDVVAVGNDGHEVARWPWHYDKPHPRQKYVTLNCYRYLARWED